jgi:protein TonB
VEVVYDLEQPAPVAAPPRLPPIIEVVAEESQIDFDPLPEGDWTRFLPPVTTVRLPSDTGFTASSRNPQLVFQAKPHYPEVARLAQVQGTVIVKVLVDAQGQVAAAEIIRGVHPLLDKAALAAARKCVFLPGQQRELKVPTWVAVPYSFHLR